MSLAILINLLLILAGPFAVVGGISAIAVAAGAELVHRPMKPRPRPVARPRPRLVVATC
jgi:hypothetical protein